MNIDIVAGFFESGKTTFINKYIEKEIIARYKRILIFNCEYGIEQYKLDGFDGISVKSIDIFKQENFTVDKVDEIICEFNPDYVLVEFNGVWDISHAIEVFRNQNIKNIITILDYDTMKLYISNMEMYMIDKISNSDIVVLNKVGEAEDVEIAYKTIKSINRSCDVFIFDDVFSYEEDVIQGKYFSKSDVELLKFGLLFILFFAISFVIKYVFSDFYNDEFQRILGIFLSLIIQILPFLLIGSILSGIIQVLVPSEKINSIFKKTNFKSIILALFAGILFPVCDCAMVPISTSILKKGYSYPVAITFLIASPAVNPVVIFSTYYAFPNKPEIVIYRVFTGLILALIIGVILMIVDKSRKIQVITEDISDYRLLNSTNQKIYFKNKLRYLEALVLHTKRELFKIGYYVVIGAFLSAFLQVIIPKSVFLDINNINSIAVMSMIVAGFFISICSTSNAFIARSFYNIMPLNSILAFMVVGPLIDITNLSVMFGVFKRKFLVTLVLLIVYLSFVMFSFIGGVLGVV